MLEFSLFLYSSNALGGRLEKCNIHSSPPNRWVGYILSMWLGGWAPVSYMRTGCRVLLYCSGDRKRTRLIGGALHAKRSWVDGLVGKFKLELGSTTSPSEFTILRMGKWAHPLVVTRKRYICIGRSEESTHPGRGCTVLWHCHKRCNCHSCACATKDERKSIHLCLDVVNVIVDVNTVSRVLVIELFILKSWFISSYILQLLSLCTLRRINCCAFSTSSVFCVL